MSDRPSAIIYTGELTDTPGRWEKWTETVVPRVRGAWSLRIRSAGFFGNGPVETTTERFASGDALVEYLRQRDVEDEPRSRIGSRLAALDEYAKLIGRTDVVAAIQAIRRPTRTRAPKVLNILGATSIASFPNGRGRAIYLKVQTDRGPALIKVDDDETGAATCWLGDRPHFRPHFMVRLNAAMRAAAATASALGTDSPRVETQESQSLSPETISSRPTMSETPKTKPPSPSSSGVLREPAPWFAARLEALDDRLRASGLTVTVVEGSDSTEFRASIPQGRRPRAAQPARPTGADPSAKSGGKRRR
jgi:hypothetical protein